MADNEKIIDQQPGKEAEVPWMERPTGVMGVPPGLEYLTQVDQLLVHQKVELAEVISNIQFKNKYVINNTMGQQVYYAYEESGLCMRLWCKGARGFVMHIVDNAGNEVMRVVRRFRCCVGCCWCISGDCCAFKLQVEAPPGNVIGYVRQSCSSWRPLYEIMDETMETLFHVRGPCCPCQCFCGCTEDKDFVIWSPDMTTECGKVSKQWAGFVKEAFAQADNFSIKFPMDMDAKAKAIFFGAMFLIEFMYFEQQG